MSARGYPRPVNGFLAPLLGCLLGSVLLACGIAIGVTEGVGAGLLLAHGGLLLWGWAVWVQQPEHG